MFSRTSLQESQKESQYAIYYYIYKCKKKKRLSKYFIRIYQHVMIPFSITMKTVLLMRKSNSSLPFKRSLRNFDKELEEAKIYFYIYEDTKNIGT